MRAAYLMHGDGNPVLLSTEADGPLSDDDLIVLARIELDSVVCKEVAEKLYDDIIVVEYMGV